MACWEIRSFVAGVSFLFHSATAFPACLQHECERISLYSHWKPPKTANEIFITSSRTSSQHSSFYWEGEEEEMSSGTWFVLRKDVKEIPSLLGRCSGFRWIFSGRVYSAEGASLFVQRCILYFYDEKSSFVFQHRRELKINVSCDECYNVVQVIAEFNSNGVTVLKC